MTTVDDSSASSRARAPRRWARHLLLGAIALLVAAVAVAAWFGIAMIKAGNDASVGRAKTRDEVDRIARQAIVTFNTLDYHKIDEGMNNWEAASTGQLHDEVVGRRKSAGQAIVDAKATTSGNVLSLAVTDLNEFDGTATVIAALLQTVTLEGKQPEPKFQRVRASLQRTGDGWKLNAIEFVDYAR